MRKLKGPDIAGGTDSEQVVLGKIKGGRGVARGWSGGWPGVAGGVGDWAELGREEITL